MVSKLPGAVFDGSSLSMPPSNQYSQVWLQTYIDENISNTFGGAIYVAGDNVPITVIENTNFYNNFGDSGASISFFRGGGLFCKSCKFELDERFGDPIKNFVEEYNGRARELPNPAMKTKSSIIKNNYHGVLPREFLVDDDFLVEFIDDIDNTDGQINLQGSTTTIKNAATPMFAKNMTTLEDFIYETFNINVTNSTASALIDSDFFSNVGQTSSAISLYDSNLDLLASEDG